MVPASALQMENALNISKHLVCVEKHLEMYWNFASCKYKYIFIAIKRLVNNNKAEEFN